MQPLNSIRRARTRHARAAPLRTPSPPRKSLQRPLHRQQAVPFASRAAQPKVSALVHRQMSSSFPLQFEALPPTPLISSFLRRPSLAIPLSVLWRTDSNPHASTSTERSSAILDEVANLYQGWSGQLRSPVPVTANRGRHSTLLTASPEGSRSQWIQGSIAALCPWWTPVLTGRRAVATAGSVTDR